MACCTESPRFNPDPPVDGGRPKWAGEYDLVRVAGKTFEVVFTHDCDCGDPDRVVWSDDVPEWKCKSCGRLAYEFMCGYCGSRCQWHERRLPYCTGCSREVDAILVRSI